MTRAGRFSAILDQVVRSGSADVTVLAEVLGVSAATVRRDLQSLDSQGLLVRTHGGAIAGSSGIELLMRHRTGSNQLEKQAIALYASTLVPDGATVGMTGGTTTMGVARALLHSRDVTVVTNAINVASELMLKPNLRVVVVGGNARHASYELVGPAAESTLRRYHLDMAFIGVDGLTVSRGCTTHDEMEAQTDRAMIEQSDRVVVVADHSKLGRVTFAGICSTAEITDLVTDAGADPDQLSSLQEAGVRVAAVPLQAGK